jgi:hypothetical protein
VRNFYQTSELGDVPDHLLVGEMSPFADQESKRLVKEALGMLNEVQSRVLKLAYFEGLSFKKIADRTGENLGNVRHHYYRGLSRLRTIISEPAKAKVQVSKQEPADNWFTILGMRSCLGASSRREIDDAFAVIVDRYQRLVFQRGAARHRFYCLNLCVLLSEYVHPRVHLVPAIRKNSSHQLLLWT